MTARSSTAHTFSATPDVSTPFPDVPLSERFFTGPRGGRLNFLRDSLLAEALHGVTSARAIIFDPDNPNLVVMRRGKNGRYGPLGGAMLLAEHPALCVIRESKQEGRLASLPDMRFISVLVHEGEGLWLGRQAWDSWGYSTRGRVLHGNKIWVAQIRTAIFAAPLAEGFRERHVENRNVRLIDLSDTRQLDKVRPMFRHLMGLWMAKHERPGSIPALIRYTR